MSSGGAGGSLSTSQSLELVGGGGIRRVTRNEGVG